MSVAHPLPATGEALYTKSGHRINVPVGFHHAMPPGFPIVGELYMGAGHNHFHAVVALSQNKLPKEYHSGAVWQHVRIIAFDVPGCPGVSYAACYGLLFTVVGAWCVRLKLNDRPILCVLQVVRQYPMTAVAQLFREVVEGMPWNERQHPAFGVPVVSQGRHAAFVGGVRHNLRVLVENQWLPEGAVTMFGDASSGVTIAGEGLMLWDQQALWVARGARGSPSTSILKYKPTVLTVGRVTRGPYLSATADDADDDSTGCGAQTNPASAA